VQPRSKRRAIFSRSSLDNPGGTLFKAAFLLPAILVYTVILLLPILDSLRMSFYSGDGLTPGKFAGLANYVAIFSQSAFRDRVFGAFGNNILFFFMVTLAQNVLGLLVAWAVTRKMRGAGFLRKVSFLPTTLSVLVVGFLFKQMLNPVWGMFGSFPWLGNANTALPVLAIAVSWQFIGESVLLYTAGIDAIPVEILEAAHIDGASWFVELKSVILPTLKPIIGLVTLLIFVGDFTQFDIVYAMSTTMANPRFSTDLFGSLFYRTAFSSPVRGGWGIGMGAAVSTIMLLVVGMGIALWYYFFKIRNRED
jgi:raffinose/stachyose/melibiose transport system permease protein